MTHHAPTYLQALPTAVVAVAADMSIAHLNPAAESLLSASATQMMGKPLSSLPGFDDVLSLKAAQCFSGRETMRLLEQPLRLPSGQKLVTIEFTPIYETATAAPTQLLITIERGTGLDKLAASSWKQEATRTAGVMAAMLAHEVKNPLSGIRGAAQLMRGEVATEHEPLISLICSEVDRVRDLLAQVEVFAGGVPGPLSPVNIHEVLQYVISIAKTGFAQHVTFREKYDPSLPPVLGHRDMMIQLFLNLVKNAAEALKDVPGAAITLTTAYRSGQRVRLGTEGEKQSLPILVGVEDNGHGIPESIRARLFEPFMTSKEGGSGLGLAIVAKLASDLGALAELDEQHTSGTRFLISLPSATQQLTAPPVAATLAPEPAT